MMSNYDKHQPYKNYDEKDMAKICAMKKFKKKLMIKPIEKNKVEINNKGQKGVLNDIPSKKDDSKEHQEKNKKVKCNFCFKYINALKMKRHLYSRHPENCPEEEVLLRFNKNYEKTIKQIKLAKKLFEKYSSYLTKEEKAESDYKIALLKYNTLKMSEEEE